MHIDEDIFKECRIIARAYRKEDVTSTHVKGKLIVYENKNMLSINISYILQDSFIIKAKWSNKVSSTRKLQIWSLRSLELTFSTDN